MNWYTHRQKTHKADRSRRKCERVALLLLSLFLSYQVGITMFGHAHMVDGEVLVHSHPFNTPQHSHSDGQILTLAQLGGFWGLVPIQPFLQTILYGFVPEIQVDCLAEFCPVRPNVIKCLRAPPF